MEYAAVALWWLAFVGLGVVGLPIATLLLRTLPDRGAALALPLGLVVLFVPIYWLGHVRFSPAVVAVGGVTLAAVSAVSVRRSPEMDLRRFGEWGVVFTMSFLLLVAVRAVDPSIVPAGGEKFLDYGLLQALLRATSLPPQDMWFAGEPVAYYYGGHLLAAILATLTATPARIGYNLALAGFYGALVGAAYGLAGSLGAARGRSYRVAGVMGAFLVGLASNVAPLLQTVLWALPDPTAETVAIAVADRTALPEDALSSPEAFSYWDASRVIPGTINEFPLFAFVNGDLHAHMMSTPFLLLVVGIGLAYYATPSGEFRRRRLLIFGAVPFVAGPLAVINTWSLPTAIGLTALAVLFARPQPRDLLPRRVTGRLSTTTPIFRELERVASAVIVALVVGLLAVLWALPFMIGPATGAEGRSLGILPDRSGLLAFVLVHGWFLAVYGVYLGTRSWSRLDRRALAIVVGGIVVVGLVADAAAVALVLPLLGLAWYLLRRAPDVGVGYETVLFVAGAGLVLVVEFLFIDEQAGPGRYNTVFKTYMQVWVLWATGTAGAIASFLPPSTRLEGWRRDVASALVVGLVASASIYGVLALGSHFEDSPDPTLDATAVARTHHAEEWEAIQFLDAQPGTPTIVSAPGCWCNPGDSVRPYTWSNAPSTFTGIPTVAGWSHEVGYRGREPYMRRVDDVRAIYTGDQEQRTRLLRQYGVRYVYVGPNERALYDDPALDGTPALTVAFRNEAVTIYEVDPSAS